MKRVLDFFQVTSDGTRGNSLRPCQVNQARLRLNIRINFFMGSVVFHWNRLPWETVGSPSLKVLRDVDVALTDLV